MKTINEVKNEISQILLDINDLNKEFRAMQKQGGGVKRISGKIKKQNQRIKELKQLILYLESNPSPEFLQCQKDDLNKKIKAVEERFQEWMKWNSSKVKGPNPRKYYEKHFEIPEMKNKVKTIDYLLT